MNENNQKARANEITHLVNILQDLHSDELQMLSAVFKLNNCLLLLDYMQVTRVVKLLSQNESLLKQIVSLANEAGPLTYHVIRLIATMTMDEYARKRFLRLGIMPMLFGLWKSKQYALNLEIFYVLQNYCLDDENMIDAANDLSNYGFSIPILASFLDSKNDKLKDIGVKMMGYLQQTPKGRTVLDKYGFS